MAKNITRRQAAKTIALGTGAAIIAPAALADSDTRLMALEADWLRLMDYLNNSDEGTEDEIQAAAKARYRFEETMAATPATSPVGIGVKLRVFHWLINENAYDEGCAFGELLHSIRRDLGETFYQYPSLNRA